MTTRENYDSPLGRFVQRLRLHSDLSDEDADAIFRLQYRSVTRERHSFVMRQGDELPYFYVLISGFVERHRISQSGEKQLLYFYLPGDPLNLESLVSLASDDAMQVIKTAEIAAIKSSDMRELMLARPAILDALIRSLLVDASAFREWIFNVGQRDARSRIAHLLCELGVRMRAVGLADDGFHFPLTQMHIAEATGLTPIHVNRTLRVLQSDGLISYRPSLFQILDWDQLVEVADFSAGYLHIGTHSTPDTAKN